MTHTQWEDTIRSKVQSSWNLHTLLPRNLEFFILLSSIAGVLGSAGQSNYTAGCTFQDSLARYRTSHQQKAISVDLGLMRTIGIVAETEKLHKNFEDAKSLRQVEEEEFLTLLDIYCDPSHPLPAPSQSQITMGAVTPADLISQEQEPVEIMQRPLFANFSQTRGISRGSGPANNTINAAALFRQAGSDEERATVVVDALARKLARALSISPEDVDSDKPLHAFGVDSLVAVELRNWIGKEFAADIAMFDIMGGTIVAAIGDLVAKTSKIRKGN
jgi:acyl carrier protein